MRRDIQLLPSKSYSEFGSLLNSRTVSPSFLKSCDCLTDGTFPLSRQLVSAPPLMRTATLLFPIFKSVHCHLSPLDTRHYLCPLDTVHCLCPLDSVQRHKCHACRSASGDQLLFFDFARGQELVSCKIELPSASLESRAHASLKLLDWGGLEHHIPECTLHDDGYSQSTLLLLFTQGQELVS